MNSRWISHNPKEFKVGDIICNTSTQSFLRLVVYIDDIAIWCVGLVHCSFTENNKSHPLFPIYFNEIENSEEQLTKLGNLNDYAGFIKDIQNEVVDKIKKIDGYESINFDNSERINMNTKNIILHPPYKIITLCGSTKFKDDFLEQQKILTLQGNIVISVGAFSHSDDEVLSEDTIKMLDDMHKRKIDMADSIYVINVGG